MLRLLASLALFAALSPSAPATPSHTPTPTSVTVAGSLQSELGCPSDWQPECTTTRLVLDTSDDVWQGSWTVPAGQLRVQGGAQWLVDRELRSARDARRRERSAQPVNHEQRQVLLRPQDPLDHRQQERADRGRPWQLPV